MIVTGATGTGKSLRPPIAQEHVTTGPDGLVRTEHAESKEADGSPHVVVHGCIVKEASGHKRWDRIRALRCPTGTRRMPRSHETHSSLESVHQLCERGQARAGRDVSGVGMRLAELAARRIETDV